MGMITSCKIWTATKPRADGYSRRRIGGKDFFVHRLAWQDAYGAIQDGLLACHFCDTPSCTNPMQLFLGTVADNNADMVAKGRQAKGERGGMYGSGHLIAGESNGRHKLTRSDIPMIRLLAVAGESQRAIAKRFGICSTTADRAVCGKTWREDDSERRAFQEFWEIVFSSS